MEQYAQMASQLRQEGEQNARRLRELAGQTRDANLASQLKSLESKERYAAAQLKQMAEGLGASGGTGPVGNPATAGSGIEITNWEE